MAVAFSAVPGFAQDKLTVWWVKGFYKSEDDALYAAIKKYEQKTGVKVELSQYAVQDMNAKSVAALDAGTVPDIAYSDTYDVQTAGKWAFDGKLEDLSDVLGPMKDRFEAVARLTAQPLQRQGQEEGLLRLPDQAADAPYPVLEGHAGPGRLQGERHSRGTWKEYWSFWCDKVQPGHPQGDRPAPYGTGFPMGVESTDSFQSFLSWVDAYNVKLVDDNGKLLVDDPKVKAGLVAALHRLHPALHQGLHAAVVDDLEGSRQQRRLPQQDDGDDAQLHDLDRRQVARRRQQREPDRRAARRRPQGV